MLDSSIIIKPASDIANSFHKPKIRLEKFFFIYQNTKTTTKLKLDSKPSDDVIVLITCDDKNVVISPDILRFDSRSALE